MADEANTTNNTTDSEQGTDTTNEQKTNDESAEVIEFDKWLEKQPANVKEAFDTHVDKLQSALREERAERKKLSNEIKSLSGKAEKGSDLAKQLETLSGTLEATEKRTAFYEEAHDKVTNLRLAYTAALEYEAFKRDGSVDLDKLAEHAPELFKKKAPLPPANMGAGKGQGDKGPVNMNTMIRRSAGRKF